MFDQKFVEVSKKLLEASVQILFILCIHPCSVYCVILNMGLTVSTTKSRLLDKIFSSFVDFISYFNINFKRLKQKYPDDYVLNIDIYRLNPDFALGCHKTIDNLSYSFYRRKPGFDLHTVMDDKQFIWGNDNDQIDFAVLVNKSSFSILMIRSLRTRFYFLKEKNIWKEIESVDFFDKLKQIRSNKPLNEISIDASTRMDKQGLRIYKQKYGSTYQIRYIADQGYEARSVRYGENVLWQADDETQRCIEATVFLSNYNPIGITALIFDSKLEIIYYKFENNKWTDIDEDDYMAMVRSYRPFRGNFEIIDLRDELDDLSVIC